MSRPARKWQAVEMVFSVQDRAKLLAEARRRHKLTFPQGRFTHLKTVDAIASLFFATFREAELGLKIEVFRNEEVAPRGKADVYRAGWRP